MVFFGVAIGIGIETSISVDTDLESGLRWRTEREIGAFCQGRRDFDDIAKAPPPVIPDLIRDPALRYGMEAAMAQP